MPADELPFVLDVAIDGRVPADLYHLPADRETRPETG
jgi:hypothetical protein